MPKIPDFSAIYGIRHTSSGRTAAGVTLSGKPLMGYALKQRLHKTVNSW